VWDFEKEEHPVLHLDMSKVAGPNSNVESFEIKVKEMLNNILLSHDVNLPPVNFPIETTFSYAINKLKLKHKKPVVVIIDEYDKPILDLLDKPDQMEAVRESLQSFYSVLKSEESNLRLVFLTGLYKFTEMSMFSTLNNLRDISLDVNAGTLMGYTESDVRAYFSKHIRALKTELSIEEDDDVMNRLRESYNGYRFGVNTANGKVSEPIYNPFAINYVFSGLQFSDNWSLSGSASMLSDKLVAAGNQYDSLLSTTVDALKRSYKPSDMSPTSLMYYGGYATIDSFEKETDEIVLKIPNASVKKYLAQNYLESIFSKAGPTSFEKTIKDIFKLLTQTPISGMDSKIKEIEEKFDKLLSHFSYDALGNEDNFQNIMDTIFKTRFNQVLSQWRTKDGRIDTIVIYDSRIFVIEYKYNKSSEKALDQIHDKKYYDDAVVMESKLPILLLGINLMKDASNNKHIKISYELCRGSNQ
jgi:hypothetical protein